MFNNTDKRYNQYSAHLKNKFGVKVYKITLDAGFSCPNRDGTISSGGCIFCDEGGSFSQAHSNLLTIEQQVEEGVKNLSTRFKAQKFMSYFQAYSNTYKPVNELEKIYKSALNHKDIVGLSIGTRPDCIDEEIVAYLSELKTHFKEFWIELGLHEKTKEAGLNVCVHVIFGLWETHDKIMHTAKELARLGVDGVKIHMLCALKDTKLAKIYEAGEIDFMDEDEYIQTVCDFLEYLPENTTIHRLAGNGLKKNLIAPLWLGKKMDCLNKIDREFVKRNSYQGCKNIYK